jgi:hypothetical protein
MNNPITETPMPPKPIFIGMNTLADKLAQMNELLLQLEDELEDVLVEPSLARGDDDNVTVNTSSPLYQKIINECRAVESMLDKLNDIRNRLEV